MSTIEQSDIIDHLTVDVSGSIDLVVVDPLDWSDTHAHIFALQRKLDRYLDFVESGEVFERLRKLGHEVAHVTPIKITIVARYPLPDEPRAFFEYARDTVAKSGVQLHHQVRL